MPARRLSPLGAHIQVGGGLARTGLAQVEALGARAVQIFVSNPRAWAVPVGDPAQDATFRDTCARMGIPTFVHAPYLVNVGSPAATTLRNSVAALAATLARASAVGAQGVVVHTGSAVTGGQRDAALKQVREALLPLLDALPEGAPDLLLEPTAGQGQALCSRVDELAPYLDVLDSHPRVGVCLDTCHLFAAGHDLAAPGGVRSTLNAVVKVAGRGALRLVHVNDSKDPCGSGKDRHANIGAGRIGADAFAELFRHPATRGVPMVIETPGSDAERRADVDLLVSLRDR